MRFNLIPFAAISIILAGCNNLDNDDNTFDGQAVHTVTQLTRAQQNVADCQQDFCIDFFQGVAELEKGSNFMISPFSMSVSLAMLSDGASGTTYSEIVKALRLEGYEHEDVDAYYSAILNELKNSNLKCANALWYDKNANLIPDYMDNLKKYFSAPATQLNFKDKAKAKSTINDWVSNNTNGKIKDLIRAISSDCRVILTNAVYFNEKWAGEYIKETNKFTDCNGRSANRDYFKGGSKQYINEYNTFDIDNNEPSLVQLPYENSFYMWIIVPPASQNIESFISELTYSKLHEWMHNCYNRNNMTVHVPMFSDKYSLDSTPCKKVLSSMGINEIFEPSANFQNMSKDQLYVESINQKTTVTVSEKGTEAAAATAINMNIYLGKIRTEDPYDFYVDRPFVYAITDTHNTMLFMGTFVK